MSDSVAIDREKLEVLLEYWDRLTVESPYQDERRAYEDCAESLRGLLR